MSAPIHATSMCVRCLKRAAKFYTGHVAIGRRRIMAGWCSTRCYESGGFFGHWLPAMNPKPKAREHDRERAGGR